MSGIVSASSPRQRLQNAASWGKHIITSSPSRFAIVIFALLILVFTVLLSLPIASADRTVTPLADALFTAVSTICVTGLSTVDMATHWSPFGHVLVFIGVNIGALGVLTLASLIRRYDFAPEPGYELDVHEAITLKPRDLRVRLSPA